MTRHDRTLAAVSAIALIVITILAFSPAWVLYPAIGVAFLLLLAATLWAIRTSEPPGGSCDRIDQELDAEDRERNVRRLHRQMDRERAHPPRLAIVREQGADVIRFLPPSDAA
jgi:CHASE2 domain-containing sensor protein